MYQHPQALHLNANYLQDKAQREADNRRLVRLARSGADEQPAGPSPFQRRMVALAMALLTILGIAALI